MLFLLVKYSSGIFEVVSPDTYGMETWGTTSQEGIEKFSDGWYATYWSDGGQWLEDTNEAVKLNVVLDTTSINDILSFILKEESITHDNKIKIVEQIKEIVDNSLNLFYHMYLNNKEY